MITEQLTTAQVAASVVGSSGEQVNSHSSGSHRFRQPLKELLGVVVAQWFTQRRLVEVDEHEIATDTLGYLGPLELIVGVEVDDVGSDRDRSGKATLGEGSIRVGTAAHVDV